jgi:hypothetical protein
MCDGFDTHAAIDAGRYANARGAHVGPIVLHSRYEGYMPAANMKSGGPTKKCRDVTWDPSANVRSSGMEGNGEAMLGSFVVDKIGDEQDMPLGMKVTPYKAHFVPTDLGGSLIAAKLVQTPQDIGDGQVVMHKDADGKWIAN